MKKLCIVLLCLALTTTAFSQVKVRPGIKLGLNNSNLSNSPESSSKLGFNRGLFVNVHLSSFYELQVETTYSNQGATYKRNTPFEEEDPMIFNNASDLNLEYVSLSIANKFFPVKDNGLNIMLGPGIDILVSDNPNGSFLPIDLSFFGGVGYQFPFGLGLEIRYKQGIVDVRDEFLNGGNNDKILNNVIQLGVEYRFNF